MAARIDPKHTEHVRQKIKTSQLINRLQSNALGELENEMTQSQVRSALGLINKVVPDIKAIVGDNGFDPVGFQMIERRIVRSGD